jgi:hypothetical protein
MANKKPEDCTVCYKPVGDKCIPVDTEYCKKYLDPGFGGSSAAYTFPQIAAAWISQNNPADVRRVLVENGLIVNMTAANNLNSDQLAKVLYMFSLKKGNQAYGNLLSKIVPNSNVTNSERETLSDAKQAIIQAFPYGGDSTFAIGDSVKDFWNSLVGQSTSTTAPTIITTTKASPVTIGLIIGGIAVLGIIAYIVVKS